MEDSRFNEAQFMEYLDRLLAGEDIHAGVEASDDERKALEFARTMLEFRDEPSPLFKESLKERLMRKQAEEAQRSERRGWLASVPPRMVWRMAASAAAVALVVIVGAVWYTSSAGKLATGPLPAADYSISLPSNVVPENVTFIVETSLSEKPKEATVYRVESPEVTVESAVDLGRRLGFTGEPEFIESGDRIVMVEGVALEERKLVVWMASGAVEYGFTEPEKLYPSFAADLPSEDEAKQAAYDFLTEAELLPPDIKRFSQVDDEITVAAGGSYPVAMGAADGGEEMAQKAATYWVVNIPNQLNGSLTTGPGSRIEVNVGDGGEVVRMLWGWREIEPAYEGDIISEEQAYQAFTGGMGSLEIPLGCAQVIVEDVVLKYWIDPISEEQGFAVPVYEFTGRCVDDRGNHLEDFTGWTEALRQTY